MPEDQTPATPEPSSDDSIGAIFKRLGPAAWLGIAWTIFPGGWPDGAVFGSFGNERP